MRLLRIRLGCLSSNPVSVVWFGASYSTFLCLGYHMVLWEYRRKTSNPERWDQRMLSRMEWNAELNLYSQSCEEKGVAGRESSGCEGQEVKWNMELLITASAIYQEQQRDMNINVYKHQASKVNKWGWPGVRQWEDVGSWGKLLSPGLNWRGHLYEGHTPLPHQAPIHSNTVWRLLHLLYAPPGNCFARLAPEHHFSSNGIWKMPSLITTHMPAPDLPVLHSSLFLLSSYYYVKLFCSFVYVYILCL